MIHNTLDGQYTINFIHNTQYTICGTIVLVNSNTQWMALVSKNVQECSMFSMLYTMDGTSIQERNVQCSACIHAHCHPMASDRPVFRHPVMLNSGLALSWLQADTSQLAWMGFRWVIVRLTFCTCSCSATLSLHHLEKDYRKILRSCSSKILAQLYFHVWLVLAKIREN